MSAAALEKLEGFYRQIERTILQRQQPITGLLPASTAVTVHGDYRDAWVRDNVYSILAVWGLALAYRKVDAPPGRVYVLEKSVVKLMRGVLFCMMKQAHKVESFKYSQSLLDALHAKYNTQTGDVVVGDDEWGHLQLDATSLYLLMLAQMTASGLQIVFDLDEVDFVQNLIYYIGRAYRTPDYGLWERGNKINKGNAELNASSLGMAKAALEAMNGLDLFGARGSHFSTIHVVQDEVNRSRATLESLLPRESASKETDAALLSIIGFPAFAVENKSLRGLTRQKIVDLLSGNYGCKRFLRDGHQTVLEDSSRLYYEAVELQQFADIECEWPLFFTYLYLDALFRNDRPEIDKYREKLAKLVVDIDGDLLLPELYYVPSDSIAAEKRQPGSQQRLPNENIPLVWAQSLYYLGQLLDLNLLSVGDIDPLGRHLISRSSERKSIVQIALIAEDEPLQSQLAEYGITTQTVAQIEPIVVRPASELGRAYTHLGANQKLGLSGRPDRRLRSAITSKIFQICQETNIFVPAFLDKKEFYLTLDYHFLVSEIVAEIAYISTSQFHLGRPTLTIFLTRELITEGVADEDFDSHLSPLIELLREFQQGTCRNIPVKVGTIQQLITTASIERIDRLPNFIFTKTTIAETEHPPYHLPFNPTESIRLDSRQEFLIEAETNIDKLLAELRSTGNIYRQIELLHTIVRLRGLDFPTGCGRTGNRQTDNSATTAELLAELYHKAGCARPQPNWAVVRYAAGLLHKEEIGLADAVGDLLVRGKQIAVGKAYTEAALIDRPLSIRELISKIDSFCREDVRDRVLTQEIIIYLSLLIKTDPQILAGLSTLRVGYLIILITSDLATERDLSQAEAYEYLMRLSPFKIKQKLQHVLSAYNEVGNLVFKQESLHTNQQLDRIQWVISPTPTVRETTTSDWLQHRKREGSLYRVAAEFYPSIWRLLGCCKGLVIGDKLEKRNCLESHILRSEMTPGEKNFAMQVERLLNKIEAPEYRQLNIEALKTLCQFAERNPDLKINEYIVMDVTIGHAVRLAWLDAKLDKPLAKELDRQAFFSENYNEYKNRAWQSFYQTPPAICANYTIEAIKFLTQIAK